MTRTKLHHIFELTKPGSTNPLLGVQINADYFAETSHVIITSVMLYCYRSKSFLRGTDSAFFQGIIDQVKSEINWDQIYLAQVTRELNTMIRIHDNIKHGIGEGKPYVKIIDEVSHEDHVMQLAEKADEDAHNHYEGPY